MIIAVDGSAASGKGTLAKRLALHFDLAHLFWPRPVFSCLIVFCSVLGGALG